MTYYVKLNSGGYVTQVSSFNGIEPSEDLVECDDWPEISKGYQTGYLYHLDKKSWEPSPNIRFELSESIKTKRAELLAASDWTQLPDVPLATKSAWVEYRQKLRDLTTQPEYPLNIDWPVPPQG
jgi:Phage tail assembly chaperone protein